MHYIIKTWTAYSIRFSLSLDLYNRSNWDFISVEDKIEVFDAFDLILNYMEIGLGANNIRNVHIKMQFVHLNKYVQATLWARAKTF